MKKLLCLIVFVLLLTANVGQAQFNDSEPTFGQLPNFGHWATDGLVFYWRGLQDKDAIDESPYGNDSTITGPTWAGDHLEFDGLNDRVDTPSIINTAALTVIAWVRFNNTGHGWLVNKRRLTDPSDEEQWQLFYLSGNLRVQIFDSGQNVVGDALFTWSPDAVQFHQCAFTTTGFNGGALTLYLDGVEVASDTLSADMELLTTRVRFGAPIWSDENSTLGLDGAMKYVSIYNRTLSANEILDLYINPDLPILDDPIWLMYSPGEPPSGIVPQIQYYNRRRRAG